MRLCTLALELLRQEAQKQPNDREIQLELAEAAYYQGALTEALGAGRIAAQAGPGSANRGSVGDTGGRGDIGHRGQAHV